MQMLLGHKARGGDCAQSSRGLRIGYSTDALSKDKSTTRILHALRDSVEDLPSFNEGPASGLR